MFGKKVLGDGSTMMSVMAIIGLLVVWEAICRFAKVPDWLLPAPTVIGKAIWLNRASLPGHFATTLFASLSGFALAVAVGVPLAVIITSSKVARNILYPLFLIFESVPKVALAPLILLWVGYGMPSKVLVAAVTAFFPIVINTSAGLASVSEEMLQLSRSYGAPMLRTFIKIRLPFAMPYLFGGMKVAMTLAVIGAVVGEFVGSDTGLGFVILTASSTMNTDLVFSAMTLLSIMGVALFYAIALLERGICPWYQPVDQHEA
ncbi:ABC transporter permease [Caballeronia sp. DA-9]|uniref:ABC transporter permease n=1 Tax=Caballeronia sp. DA-9 TaxID=3436237 RepID=UPI003F680E90